MSSSVMNGAIGKSPLIDKMNQLTVREIRNRTTAQMEQQVCGGDTVRFAPVPVSFQGCKEEIRKQISQYGKGR